MAQTKAKRYYWLKLKESFFREREIKKMRRLENGAIYTIIYLKMQLLSIKNEGYLLYESTEDSMFEQLALELDEDEEMIKETIDFSVKNGLLEISGDEYFLTRVPEVIGSESESAERVRKHRKIKQALQCNTTVTDSNELVTYELPQVTSGNTEIEIKKELDLERDIDLERRLREKREDYKRYNKTETKDLEPLISQSVPPPSPENNNSILLTDNDIQYFINSWSNLNICTPIRELSQKRLEKLSLNIKRFGQNQNPIDAIADLIDSITDSSYLMGETEPKFQLLIDWVLKPENWQKIIDGDYRDFDN